MRTLCVQRHHNRLVAIVTGLAVVAWTLVAPVGPASASAGTLTQGAPTQGSLLEGSAFSDQLQVSGATGTVTFAQTTGSDSVAVSGSGQVSASASLAAGMYSASGTDSDLGGGTGTWTYTLNVLAPAPSGFANTIVGVYQSEYAVLQQLGQASAAQPVSQLQQTVSQFNQVELADFYNAVQQNPGWYQIPSLMQAVASGLPLTSTSSTMSANRPVSMAGPAKAVAQGRALSQGQARRAQGGSSRGSARRSTLNAPLSPSPAVQAFSPQPCATSPNDAQVFALQIAVDIASGVYDALNVSTNLGDIAIVLAVASVVVLAALLISHDSVAYEEAEGPNSCAGNNQSGYISNIDNTTVQTYSLLTTVAGAATQLQTAAGTTQQDVQSFQAQLSSFQSTLTQALATDTQAIQPAVGSDVQGVTSQLQTDVTGIEQDIASVQGDEGSLSQQVVNQVNSDTSSVQSALSAQLTKVLNETDSDASALTTVVNQDNQQVLNTVQTNFSAEQTDYNSDLTLEIEQALGQWGNYIPPAQFMLPASQGGFLNSTPVGVQAVVTTDLSAMAASGASVTSSATNDLKEANAALAAGQFLTAYQDFATCYQSFA
jgi:hypothetical protein